MPAQNLEGVMRSLDMVERALEEAMLMADAMPGPEESAIGKYSTQSSMHVRPYVASLWAVDHLGLLWHTHY